MAQSAASDQHLSAARQRLGHLGALNLRTHRAERRIRQACEAQRQKVDADLLALRPRVHIDQAAADEYQRLTIERGKLDVIAATSAAALGHAEEMHKAFTAAEPRTLYVNRPVENAERLLAWAASAGIPNLLPANDLHVTVAFSRQPVDWAPLSPRETELVIPSGGPRELKLLGDKGALVLRFENGLLEERWAELRHAGASWDYPGYQPHVTLSYDAPDFAGATPFRGSIRLGPERFAEVGAKWADRSPRAK